MAAALAHRMGMATFLLRACFVVLSDLVVVDDEEEEEEEEDGGVHGSNKENDAAATTAAAQFSCGEGLDGAVFLLSCTLHAFLNCTTCANAGTV